MFINYQELLTNFNSQDSLRGVTGGPPPFETWVPSEGHPDKSVVDLIDLAIDAGNEVITVNAPEAAEHIILGGYRDGMLTYQGNGQVSYYSKRAFQVNLDLQEVLHELQIDYDVRVAGLKGDVLVLDYNEVRPEDPLHYRLIAIEANLNHRQEKPLNIQTLNVEDKNKRKCRTQ